MVKGTIRAKGYFGAFELTIDDYATSSLRVAPLNSDIPQRRDVAL